MRIGTRTFPVLLALVLSLAAAMAAMPARASDDGHFDRTLTVTGAVDLDVQTGSGEITGRTGDSSKVEIHGRLHPNHGSLGGHSGAGRVRLSKIRGETRARTGSGDIELNGIHGAAKAIAGSGSIHAIGIAGALTASSGSGSVKFEQTAAGDVEIGTGSGDVEVKGAKGGVKVQTGSGSISGQGDPTGDWRLHTGSGNVSVELPPQASFNLLARTSSGSIDTNREIAVQGKLSPRELQGKVGGGGPTVHT